MRIERVGVCGRRGDKTFFTVDYLWEYKEPMPKRGTPPLQGEVLQGTLDLLILQMLVLGPAHGHTIAYAIECRSEDVLQVEHGSLYPALHRLEGRGWIASFWGTSENNRKARYYRLTLVGRKQLVQQTGRWDQLVRAINQVLGRARKPATE
jgi:PadR family transcriptional regulator, regulatory protein PadR